MSNTQTTTSNRSPKENASMVALEQAGPGYHLAGHGQHLRRSVESGQLGHRVELDQDGTGPTTELQHRPGAGEELVDGRQYRGPPGRQDRPWPGRRRGRRCRSRAPVHRVTSRPPPSGSSSGADTSPRTAQRSMEAHLPGSGRTSGSPKVGWWAITRPPEEVGRGGGSGAGAPSRGRSRGIAVCRPSADGCLRPRHPVRW